jgi:hypothetical protein
MMRRLIALHEASHIVIALTLAPFAAAQLTCHDNDYYEVVYTEDSLVTDVECGMIILAGKAVEYIHGFDPMIEGSYDANAFAELGFNANESLRIWQDTIDIVKEHYKRIAKLASQLQDLYN